MIPEQVYSLPSLCESLKTEVRPIFLSGMGNGAEKIYAYLRENGIAINGVVASEGFIRGQSFLGFSVTPISEAESRSRSLCLVLCFGLEGEKSHFLKELAKKHRIVSPNLAVFGDGAFDKKYILENKEKIERLYSLLEDDKSREIFLSLLKYNISGDITYLDANNGLVPPPNFYSHGKRHIDIGAYDGDTALEFVSYNQNYSDIVAFEPDKTTYKKLVKNTAGIRDILCINGAAGQKNGRLSFASGGGRASHCGEGNDVDCYSVDEFCGYTHIKAEGTPVGSIKIDAEGMDRLVIYGAVNTIYCCKPNICVALYHRAHDIIELPLLLRKHNPKYKFYLRKKEYIPAWDIFLYATEGE